MAQEASHLNRLAWLAIADWQKAAAALLWVTTDHKAVRRQHRAEIHDDSGIRTKPTVTEARKARQDALWGWE